MPLAKEERLKAELHKKTNKKFPILHLTATGMAQSREVSEHISVSLLFYEKERKRKNDAPKRVIRVILLLPIEAKKKEKTLQFQYFLLLSKRLKASLGNGVYFTQA